MAAAAARPLSFTSRASASLSFTQGQGSSSSNRPNASNTDQLARRLLFPSLPPNAALPPFLDYDSITSTTNALDDTTKTALDAELYTLLALALRAHVAPWWTRLTRYDRDFIPLIGIIIVHVIRELVARAQRVDMADLLCRALPAVLEQHAIDVRAARARAERVPGESLVSAYRARASHVGICAEEGSSGDGSSGSTIGCVRVEGAYVRAALDGVLREVLPPEDRTSEAERTIVREVIAKVLMVDVLPLLAQPWFLHKQITDVLQRNRSRSVDAKTSNGGSLHSIAVGFLSAVQYLSGLCLTLLYWYKRAKQMVKTVNKRSVERAGYVKSVVTCVEEVIGGRDRRTARAMFELAELGLSFGYTEAFTDRWVKHMLGTHVFTADSVLSVIRTSRDALFPGGYPGRPLEWPATDEQAVLRAQAVDAILAGVPGAARVLLLGGTEKQQRGTVEEMLNVWGTAECNVHAIVQVLDIVLVGLFPEMGAVVVT